MGTITPLVALFAYLDVALQLVNTVLQLQMTLHVMIYLLGSYVCKYISITKLFLFPCCKLHDISSSL